MARHLADYLEATAARHPARTAVVEPSGRRITYADLNRQADAIAGHLVARGVRPGDRVGLMLVKSIPAIVSLFGVVKAGAAYVPVDHNAPPERARKILSDCDVRALVLDESCLDVMPISEGPAPALVVVGASGAGRTPGASSYEEAVAVGAQAPEIERHPEQLAYILYTSGLTGVPKGVALTHENALSFVDWCSSVFDPTEADRFSSHAPLHFDLSVLDIHVAIKHGAEVHLIPDGLGRSPRELAAFIADRRLTIWYSTPSILTLLLQFGRLETHDASSLRVVFFAGEVFPIKHLRALKQLWTAPVFYNLYGPTETNVCTFARIPEHVPADRDTPYPIGITCSHCVAVVLDEQLQEVAVGEEGLLYIAGQSLFPGYWNRPKENAAAFVIRDEVRFYNTGDVVRDVPGEGYLYLGRRDRMVKRRGYRIELGEIERALMSYPRAREAAVVAVPDGEAGVRIVAFLACDGESRPSLVEIKTFCGSKIPAYMSPDRFVFPDELPKTSTDKVDYQSLKAHATVGA